MLRDCLPRYRSDPKLVDESWQAYFGDLLNGGEPTVEAKSRPEAAHAAETDRNIAPNSKKVDTDLTDC